MEFSIEPVGINHIDLKDITFKISTDSSTDDLVESIKNVGLISPPILKKAAGNKYTVVSGFRRIYACRLLQWRHVDARIISESEYDLKCLKLAIADNALNRELNVIEQAISVSKLSEFFSDNVELSRESQKTGLNVNPGLIKKLKKINGAYDDLKEKIAAGVIPLTIGLELAEFDKASAIVFSQIIEMLNPTLNHQKEMIRLTKEISRLNNVPMTAVLNDSFIAGIIKDPESNRNQKIKNIRSRLKQIRYPEIDRFEKKYLTLLQRIGLPESIQLIPPADFEGNSYSMHLVFQNLKQFKEISKELTRLQDHDDFAKIVEKEFEDN